MDVIFHNSYVTLEIEVCKHTFPNVTFFWILNCLSQGWILKHRLTLSFKGFSAHSWNHSVTCLQVAIRFWFKVGYCFSAMCYGGLVYYLIYKWCLRPLARFTRTILYTLQLLYPWVKFITGMYKIRAFSTTTLLTQLCMSIVLRCSPSYVCQLSSSLFFLKHSHDRIISFRGEVLETPWN